MTKTCMCWGFETGDGWFDLIDRLSKRIVEVSNDSVQASQVKEKFGTLRFYVDSACSDEVYSLIEQAEQESAETCDICGQPAKLTGNGWLATRCESHK